MAKLETWHLGPVLRGLSAAAAAPIGTDGHKTVGPGALFRHLPEPSSDAPSDITLTEPPTVDSIARQWTAYRERTGSSPRSVRLPSGEEWAVLNPDSTDLVEPSGSAELITSEQLGATLVGRVAVVTGAAQGFGWEIARGLAALGAVVALADINAQGVGAAADTLGAPHSAFTVDVTSEESVAELVKAVTVHYGGIDLLVSNAGVLKAGSVKTLSAKDFRFVTDVNYIGFFYMTKHTAGVMELQNQAAKTAVGTAASSQVQYLTDIVEINSKSGLVGSNRNAAYAGSKFGGIGLVQSFALELVEQGTKVNAVCPGNYLDGPLWSDPEKGLFVQYLKAGKVPGAKSVADVRRSYEAQVPMRRGCTGPDVVRAIAYIVGQEYETGQAIPVTGGQVMLS